MARKARKSVKVTINRSPTYPFVPLDRALDRLDQIKSGLMEGPISPQQARTLWGYAPGSSGGIQTEPALKQFGLLEVHGRGEGRQLQASVLGLRLLDRTHLSANERYRLAEQAALNPPIHRELRDRWPDRLPAEEARRFLVTERGFTEKGADGLIAEYEKTFRYLNLIGANSETIDGAHDAGAPNEIVVTDRGTRIAVSALVDRSGLQRLINILQEKLVK